MAALQTQLQRLQNTLSQYKKGEFLDLNLSQTQAKPRLGLNLGMELAGPRPGIV